MTAPRRGPVDVPPGTVLALGTDDWRYGSVPQGPLTVCVERVRWDLYQPRWSDAEVWVEGYRLDHAGRPSDWVAVLTRLDALPPP